MNWLGLGDFHIAMLIDVEIGREEVKNLIVRNERKSLKKHP